MYGFGGDPVGWKGKGKYDFGSARARYDSIADKVDGPRVYDKPSAPDLDLVDPRGKKISSTSENPIVLAVDVTGSMDRWPGEIFDRLPLLYQTLAKYKEDAEFCFAAIGDAYSDQFPLQVNDFAKGLDLEKKLKALFPEGNGGGQHSESYELFAYFMLNHCDTPKAKSPFLLVFGDEKHYGHVNGSQVKHYIGDVVEKELEAMQVWKALMNKFNVFYLHKAYGRGDEPDVDREVVAYWTETIGKQRIIELPSMERAVDVAMGLIAKHWGEYADFGKSLDARHDDSKLKATVHRSLKFVDPAPSPNSMMPGKSGSKMTKRLDGA